MSELAAWWRHTVYPGGATDPAVFKAGRPMGVSSDGSAQRLIPPDLTAESRRLQVAAPAQAIAHAFAQFVLGTDTGGIHSQSVLQRPPPRERRPQAPHGLLQPRLGIIPVALPMSTGVWSHG